MWPYRWFFGQHCIGDARRRKGVWPYRWVPGSDSTASATLEHEKGCGRMAGSSNSIASATLEEEKGCGRIGGFYDSTASANFAEEMGCGRIGGFSGSATNLSPELVAKIAASKEAAKKRKAARIDALKRVFPLAGCQVSDGKQDRAPDIAPHGGGRPMISNRRHAETKKAGTANMDGPAWPNDGSLATNDTSHRSAGLFAVDTVNPNARGAGAEYLQRTSADVVLGQEVKLPYGYPCEAAEQAARNAKWKLSIEPCLVTKAGGKSAGTAVATRSYIGMSTPKAVEASQALHAQGRFALRRVSAMGKGGMHCGTPYMYCGVGIDAKCNLDLLESMAFTGPHTANRGDTARPHG